jgi:hypothetical protein
VMRHDAGRREHQAEYRAENASVDPEAGRKYVGPAGCATLGRFHRTHGLCAGSPSGNLRRMREKLKQALELLPECEQDQLGQYLLDLLSTDDKQWDRAFALSSNLLDRLEKQALEEILAGRTEPLDPREALNSHTTTTFRTDFNALPANSQSLARQAYKLFCQNPAHPSLNFKQGTRQTVYVFRQNRIEL